VAATVQAEGRIDGLKYGDVCCSPRAVARDAGAERRPRHLPISRAGQQRRPMRCEACSKSKGRETVVEPGSINTVRYVFVEDPMACVSN